MLGPEQARLLSDPALRRQLQKEARLLSNPATRRELQEQLRLVSDPAVWRQAQEQAKLLGDPASWRRAQEDARLLGDPATWKRVQEQAGILSDASMWRRLQEQVQQLGDPARWQTARENVRVLTDPVALRTAEARRAEIIEALGRLRQDIGPVAETRVLDGLRSAEPGGVEAARGLAEAARLWQEQFAEVEGLDAALLEPREGGEGEFDWVAYLPKLVRMKLLVQSLSVLNMVMLAAATMGAAAVPLGVVLAAEVLIRLIDALITYAGRESD